MKNILLVFTGGTIGSSVAAHTINTSVTAGYELLAQFRRTDPAHDHVQFTTIQPLQLLSENLQPRVWQTLIAAIEAQQPEQFDGIIITHGTDTLAYTAAALSFYFAALERPILLVSSDYPLTDMRANGLANFRCAVEFIRQRIANGVFVPYRNHQQAQQVHRGTRLACSLQLSGDFVSVQGKSFMGFDNGQFTAFAEPPKPSSGAASMRVTARFSERVLMIKPYPGLNYAHINLAGVDAVIHDLYHSGTACATREWGETYSLLAFIDRCVQHKLNIYLAPAIHSEDAYQSTRALLDQGAHMLWNMSIEAAYVKLMLAYGNFDTSQQILDFMALTLAHEHIA